MPPADTWHVKTAPQHVPYRRIGAILVDRELITPAQLDLALHEQTSTGRPLGEICVSRFGLDRLSLADALAEQWGEMQAASPGVDRADRATSGGETLDPAPQTDPVADDELRVLLEEAEAARAELTQKTDELSQRLAALEALVVGVTDALAELRRSEAMPTGEGSIAKEPRKRTRGRRSAAGTASS